MSSLQKLFAVADILNMPLELKGLLLDGTSEHKVDLGALSIKVPLQVVSALLDQQNDRVAVICRSLGNLALLVIPNFSKVADVSIFVLDVFKMPSRPDDLIELKGLKTPQEVVAAVEPAIVKQFHEVNDSWVADDYASNLHGGQD
jgi:hypothetical protein